MFIKATKRHYKQNLIGFKANKIHIHKKVAYNRCKPLLKIL